MTPDSLIQKFTNAGFSHDEATAYALDSASAQFGGRDKGIAFMRGEIDQSGKKLKLRESTQESLILGFMKLGLSRQEAEIAARGSHTNSQNNGDYADDSKTIDPNSAFQWL